MADHEMLAAWRANPAPIFDMLEGLIDKSNALDGAQVLVTLTPEGGGPALIVGVQGEDYESDD